MDTQPHADPADAPESPPEKESARPFARDEQQTDTTTGAEAQSHPLINLCRAWMRCTSAADRVRFLSDIGATTDRETTGERKP